MMPTWTSLSPLTADLVAWTLLHFLWQGAALSGIGMLLVRLSAGSNPQSRYTVWLGIFALMSAAPLVTGLTFGVNATGDAVSAATTATAQIPDNNLDSQARVAFLMTGALPFQPSSVPISHGDLATSRAWSQAVVTVWIAGVILTSLRLIGAAAWMWCVVRRLEPAGEAAVKTARRLARRLGLRRLPRIAISSAVSEPLALQWFRPMVLLPASWLADVPPAVMEAVLAHELAHIRRHDLWVNLVQRMVETLLFFHPCVWWVSRQIRIERELCCDADAVRATGQPVAYAQALEVVARRRWACAPPQLAVGLGGTRMALLHRVKRVLGVESSAAESNWWTLGLAGLGVSAACWLGTTLWSSPAQGEDSSEAVAFADGEEEELRPGPRREGEPRREGREEAPRERPRGEREGEPRPPREGEPRPPREGDREGGPRPEGPREGDRGPREPGREGPPGQRPPFAIMEELMHLARESAERGQPVPRERFEQLMREMHESHPRPEGEPRFGGRGPEGEGRERPPGEPRRGGELEPRPMPPGMPPDVIQDMMHAVRELRGEVERLRAELQEVRGGRPGGVPPFLRERMEGGEREGPPRGPREGDFGPPRGPRDGEGGPRPGPRDGEGPPRVGPRDGEGPARPGPRDGEGPPRIGPRDGEGEPRRGPRDGDRPRPEGESRDRADADDQPVSADEV